MPTTTWSAWCRATRGAESVFHWDTSARTSTGAAPGRWTPRSARAAALGCTSAPAPSRCGAPSPATSWRCASSTCARGRAATRRTSGKSFRQQRGGVVGLSLQRSARGAEEARGHHDLRGRRERRAQLGAGRLQLSLDAADRSLRRRASHHRLSRRARRPLPRSRRTTAS